jgi:hypothetical protein
VRALRDVNNTAARVTRLPDEDPLARLAGAPRVAGLALHCSVFFRDAGVRCARPASASASTMVQPQADSAHRYRYGRMVVGHASFCLPRSARCIERHDGALRFRRGHPAARVTDETL